MDTIEGTAILMNADKDKHKVLIVEDNHDNYALLKSILGKTYNIMHAVNGAEAVKYYKSEPPDIILMDINMPVMNGYEAVAEIRKFSCDIPIIATTAYAYPEDKEAILQSGFNAYISKPININELRQKIQDLLKT